MFNLVRRWILPGVVAFVLGFVIGRLNSLELGQPQQVAVNAGLWTGLAWILLVPLWHLMIHLIRKKRPWITALLSVVAIVAVVSFMYVEFNSLWLGLFIGAVVGTFLWAASHGGPLKLVWPSDPDFKWSRVVFQVVLVLAMGATGGLVIGYALFAFAGLTSALAWIAGLLVFAVLLFYGAKSLIEGYKHVKPKN